MTQATQLKRIGGVKPDQSWRRIWVGAMFGMELEPTLPAKQVPNGSIRAKKVEVVVWSDNPGWSPSRGPRRFGRAR